MAQLATRLARTVVCLLVGKGGPQHGWPQGMAATAMGVLVSQLASSMDDCKDKLQLLEVCW